MADPSRDTYESPLKGYENASPLPDEKAADGKSYLNHQTGVLSKSYERFTDPLDNGIRGGFDIHIYYFHKNPTQLQFAKDLWKRIRLEFPELRIYRFWEEPIGPHPLAMFEVNLFTPAQFGAFIPWLVINRGPLSALIHPNCVDPETGAHEDEYRDHTQRATWMGNPVALDLQPFQKREAEREKKRALEKKQDNA
ncbi:uncharacterized protein LY89DRAFT_441296 [Mollisia scopiformis]|uniref:DOPA 4,5-dioxygenase n=1 Tax=Mollisia scopiformis TaxID=149040 RepID=A0A194XJN3_MOLSC|nr:uncharacterized protein LY89DRAFT_441296 [Mollisia scopiformis]KUJ20341.1 hypothetical protein LY89DRAFT_441296 [Mollisia scopiformis]